MGFYTRRASIQGPTEYESDALPTDTVLKCLIFQWFFTVTLEHTDYRLVKTGKSISGCSVSTTIKNDTLFSL